MSEAVREAARDIIAGTIGGIAGRIIEYPFDTVKTKLQAASIGLSRSYNGAVDCFLRTVQEEGVQGLFRGMAAPLAATMIETSTLFFTNGFMKRVLRAGGHIEEGEELPMPYVYVAGAATGLVVSFVLTPIELIKCRLQVATTTTTPAGASGPSAAVHAAKYAGPLDCFVKSVQREGLGVMFRGHSATMLREIPGTACWFGAYEAFARAMTPPGARREDLSSWNIIAAGAFGGVAYWAVMYPADTIKSAMQIVEEPSAATQASEAAEAAEAAAAARAAAGPSLPATSGAGATSATAAAATPSLSARTLASAAAAAPARAAGVFPHGSLLQRAAAFGVAAAATSASTASSRLLLGVGAGRATAAAAAAGISGVHGSGPGRPAASVAGSIARAASSVAAAAAASVAAPGAYDNSFMGTARSIYASGGVRGYYAGFVPTLLRAAPSNAAIFVFYEWANARLKPYM